MAPPVAGRLADFCHPGLMNIEGTYTLQASPEKVWQCLTDKAVLRHALPGLTQIEERGKETYAVSFAIQQAPLAGTYTGQLTITDRHAPYYCHFTLEGAETTNAISGEGTLHLNERHGNTVLAYKGNITFGQLVPPLVTRGAAKLLTQQFFIALAEQLRQRQEQPASTHPQTDDLIILSSQASAPNGEVAYPVSLKVVRLLRLGEGDPEQEELWATRLRQASILSGLLFLVWLGTRLPRRAKVG